jgi:hypothetical protein
LAPAVTGGVVAAGLPALVVAVVAPGLAVVPPAVGDPVAAWPAPPAVVVALPEPPAVPPAASEPPGTAADDAPETALSPTDFFVDDEHAKAAVLTPSASAATASRCPTVRRDPK